MKIEKLEKHLEALEVRLGPATNSSVTPGQTRSAARHRINLLCAYGVLHNNFNINQTGIVIERGPKYYSRYLQGCARCERFPLGGGGHFHPALLWLQLLWKLDAPP